MAALIKPTTFLLSGSSASHPANCQTVTTTILKNNTQKNLDAYNWENSAQRPRGKTSSGLRKVFFWQMMLEPWVFPELLFQLRLSPLTHLMPELHGSRFFSSQLWSKWKCNPLTVSMLLWKSMDHMTALLHMYRQLCRWLITLNWEMKEKVLSRLLFSRKPSLSFVCSPHCCPTVAWHSPTNSQIRITLIPHNSLFISKVQH